MQISYNIMTGPSQTTLARSVILSQTNKRRFLLRQMEGDMCQTISLEVVWLNCKYVNKILSKCLGQAWYLTLGKKSEQFVEFKG